MANTLPKRPQLSRSMLAQVFKDPRTLLAFENILQQLSPDGSVFETGDIKPFAGANPPEGWLVCDGSAVSRSGYPNLFSVISTTWGAGDGQNTFNLPDLRDRSLVGASATKALGSTGGSATVILTVGQLPAHNHGVTDPKHAHTITDPEHAHTAFVATSSGELALDAGQSGATSVNGSTSSSPTGVTVNEASTGITIQDTGQGDPVPTLSPYAAVNWLIKT